MKKTIKTIAFYLPQFHSIPENDKWWGKDFTEWTNVKRSVPIFKKHNQPEIPLNDNYYSLLDNSVQEYQSKLALKHGLDGFCYYHYWFEGKLLLEKPMEAMLDNDKIEIPFCICWANETWSRTWNGEENNILIKQNYEASYKDWKKHFDYLLPFFLDSRYIIDRNRPVFIIYKPHLIKNCSEMLSYWNELAIEAGFDGLFFGFQHHSVFDSDIKKIFDFGIEFEPFYTVRELMEEKRVNGKIKYFLKNPSELLNGLKKKVAHYPTIYNYDVIWKRIISRKPSDVKIVAGAFTAWDNTPRRNKDASIFFPATPEKFKKYFKKRIVAANNNYQMDYLFINAWNEWAEGAHLEPDTTNEYGYLEGLKEGIDFFENLDN